VEHAVYTQNGILFIYSEKELNPTICSNMDGARGHYVKWNMPDTVRNILPYYTFVETIKSIS
jgi:hypothetical protein